jgi:hypothetical protein
MLCGYVVAGRDFQPWAYMVLIEDIFADINSSDPAMLEVSVPSREAFDAAKNELQSMVKAGKRVDRQSTHSPVSSKQNRGGLFSLAALTLDKTSSAIASFSEPSHRDRPSSGNLYRTAQSSPTSELNNSSTFSLLDRRDNSNSLTGHHNISTPTISHNRSDTLNTNTFRNSLLETNPLSQAYSNTASDTPAPIGLPQSNFNKMHQTSSPLLRMTSDGRPFTRVRATTSRPS